VNPPEALNPPDGVNLSDTVSRPDTVNRPEVTGRRGPTTLRLRGPVTPLVVDPACWRNGIEDRVTRLFARTLFAYPPRDNLRDWQAYEPVGDLATAVPSTYNAGLGASHLSYVVHLRPEVVWDTTPTRPVTAHDVVRAFKRLAHPAARNAALPYLLGTVRGLAEFHAGYARVGPTAADMSDYQAAHDISGVFALDDTTVMVELIRPALDFVDVLTLPCFSPAPAEYDLLVPGDPGFVHHVRSTGPYRPVPGDPAALERNPWWRKDTDPVREQHLDRVEFTVDDAVGLAARIAADEADLPWATPLLQPDGKLDARGFALDPYLVFNGRGRARDAAVRRALAQALDRLSTAELVAEPGFDVLPAGSLIPPGCDGHEETPVVPLTGAPERCRARLAEEGHADLALTLVCVERDAAVASAVTADLEKAGVTVRTVVLDDVRHRAVLDDPDAEWDAALACWSAPWFHRNGRVFVQALGDTGDPEVGRLVDRALAAVAHPDQEAEHWRAAQRAVLANAAVAPLLFRRPSRPPLRGPRVRDARILPSLGHSIDLATVRVEPDADR
jgi:peptide/nickel transport system substrate-binding protein